MSARQTGNRLRSMAGDDASREEQESGDQRRWRVVDLGLDQDGGEGLRCRFRAAPPVLPSWLLRFGSACNLFCGAPAACWEIVVTRGRSPRNRRGSAARGEDEGGEWLEAQVCLVVDTSSEDAPIFLQCAVRTPDNGRTLRVPLAHVEGIRRLRYDHDRLPGFELNVRGVRPRLQLIAESTNSEETQNDAAMENDVSTVSQAGRHEPEAEIASSTSRLAAARLQLLHAFVAEVSEQYCAATADALAADRIVRPLEWPLEGGRRATLAHLASVLRGVTITEPREVPSRAKFAGQVCAICWEPWDTMPDDRTVAALACGHAFCERCLGSTVQHQTQQATCPSCRRGFGPG